jgi:hypothetical protein
MKMSNPAKGFDIARVWQWTQLHRALLLDSNALVASFFQLVLSAVQA